MPITITENRGLRRIEALVQKVGDASMLELCEKLAAELVQDLSTVPWGGNIKRGLTYMTAPKRTSTGGWMIGVGSLDILHREKAPLGTISAFLEWYRGQVEERKKARAKEAAAAKGIKAKKAAETRRYQEIYRRATFEQMEIEQARMAGTLTREMILKEETLYREYSEAERKLSKLMTAVGYERFTSSFDKLIEAEQKKWERERGIRLKKKRRRK